jgi:PAS domain S-box-containing protein
VVLVKFIGNFKKLYNHKKPIQFEEFIEGSLFLVFMGFMLLMSEHSHLFFHTSIELFINFVFLLVFVFTFNTYSINKNTSLLILGTGYFFVAVVGIFHLLTYPGMPFLSERDSRNVATQLWISTRYVGVLTNLLSVTLILNPRKKINPCVVFITYFCITAFLLLSIFIFKIFPTCYIESIGLTSFKVISEYVISAMFIITAIIYFRLRKNVDKYLFIFLECFLISSAVSEMFFTSYMIVSDFSNVMGHIIKIISAYFLYKGVVEVGLKRPYNIINYNLGLADSKLKQFEEIILKNEQCCNMIINNSDNAIFVLSDNKFEFVNKKMVELLGAESADNIIGLDVDKIIIDEVRDFAYQHIHMAIDNRQSVPFTESKLLRFDGTLIDIEVTNCFFTYNGKPSLMAMFRDITPQKQIRLLENDIVENKKIIDKTNELNKMMTEFFSNISHELKTPLNVILGAVQILSLPSNDILNISIESKLNKYLKTMKQNCYRLVRLVNNVIDISKFDSGFFKLNLHNHNIVSVVEDIALSVADYAEHKGIELLFDTDAEEKYMAIDLDKIERIILNLLSNAIKFTNVGGQILVSLFDKHDNIFISIKDTGVGIPYEKLNIIFERFGQVDKTLYRNYEGSGIGLSLVKSIVDMHNGNIKVLSEFGKGSEFIIELPVRLIEEEITTDSRLYESKVEKISIEFSDIYS